MSMNDFKKVFIFSETAVNEPAVTTETAAAATKPRSIGFAPLNGNTMDANNQNVI